MYCSNHSVNRVDPSELEGLVETMDRVKDEVECQVQNFNFNVKAKCGMVTSIMKSTEKYESRYGEALGGDFAEIFQKGNRVWITGIDRGNGYQIPRDLYNKFIHTYGPGSGPAGSGTGLSPHYRSPGGSLVMTISILTGRIEPETWEHIANLLELPVLSRISNADGSDFKLAFEDFARVLITFAPEEQFVNWLERDLEFWLGLFDIDTKYISTSGWPQFPGIADNNGRIIADKFFPTSQSACNAGIESNPRSAYFGFKLLGGAKDLDGQRHYTKLTGSSVVFHWFYPFLVGERKWVEECVSHIVDYYQSKGCEVNIIKQLETFERIAEEIKTLNPA